MLLTVEQAADRLGTSVRFIRRLRSERRIAVIKLGRHIRIDSDDLEAYVRVSRQEPARPGSHSPEHSNPDRPVPAEEHLT